MKIIPVIDLLRGQVVRGIAGNRAEYRPVKSVLTADSTPASVASAFAHRFGFDEVYVADLDAIAGETPDWVSYKQIASAGMQVMVDAGFPCENQMRRFLQHADSQATVRDLIVGLESTQGPESLSAQFTAIGVERAIFSLDMQHGRPLTLSNDWRGMSVTQIARTAADIGFARMIALDLADVGTDGGPSFDMYADLRMQLAEVELWAGGGIRNVEDIIRFEQLGCDAVLVASALHDGRLTRDWHASLPLKDRTTNG